MSTAETLAAMATEELIDLIRRGLDADERGAESTHRDACKWVVFRHYYPCSCGVRSRVLADVDSRRRTLVRCEEELLSGIPRLAHFARQTLRDMARPYLDREAS